MAITLVLTNKCRSSWLSAEMSKTVVVAAVNVVAQAKLTWQSPLDLLESPFDLSRGHTLSNVITLNKMLLLMMLMLELFFTS